MRILVLGGTVFLSEAVAAEALRRGHDVVCACRADSGTVPDGAQWVRWDRSAEPAPGEEVGGVDVVVDVARQPSWVRAALSAWTDAHWIFVSTVNVYSDDSLTGGTPDTLPLHPARHADADLAEHPEAYGPLKRGCEEAVLASAASAMVIRPGLICGPGDPTGRFSYWPARLAEARAGGRVLAGGEPDDVVQIIDVRDLASWIVTAAEQRTTGVYDGVGPVSTTSELLEAVAAGVGATPELAWVPGSALTEAGVEPWMGPGALPLWLPRPDYDGLMSHDPGPSFAAGLSTRPVAETARDTLAWLRAEPDPPSTGLSRAREQEVLNSLPPT
ncbi:NAD-dependent epimerase/dehydratase family protein [Nocardioides sp. GXZ039]|uniref:NAD-dependent epimerase/dehydratase family protein n=1 Tax=Nocardioides sp. GXZ039 TaxID=3136018 RepID=UPI0030F43CD0